MISALARLLLSCSKSVDIWKSKLTPSQTQMVDSMHSSQCLLSKPAAPLCEITNYQLKAVEALELLIQKQLL